MANIIVLDLETLHSADDLPTGWENKPALGLSIGAYYDYRDDIVRWFDRSTLVDTMSELVLRQPLMVSFNGIGFDFPLMRGLLRQQSDDFRRMCDAFKDLAARSYDILAEIWRVDPVKPFAKGLNSLDAILAANGLPPKTGHGAQAPKDWQAGQYAKVLNYCQDDVLLEKRLFECIIANNGTIQRSNGPITLPLPSIMPHVAKTASARASASSSHR